MVAMKHYWERGSRCRTFRIRSNRLDDTGHFHFRDLEMTSSRSSKVKFRKADIDFPIVFHSNHTPVSLRFEAGADVCSRKHRVGSLTLPLLDSGSTDFDAVWCPS